LVTAASAFAGAPIIPNRNAKPHVAPMRHALFVTAFDT
jgi:hypothetical protein